MIDRWAPGLGRLLRYERSLLSGDVASGLTVGALVITQCMAYAPIAGLPPSAALRGAVIGIPLSAMFGSSRHRAIGPDPGTATLAAAGLATVAVVGTDQYATAAAVLALLVGGILFVASMLRTRSSSRAYRSTDSMRRCSSPMPLDIASASWRP